MLRLRVARPGEFVAEAASIWAEATAARDGDPRPAGPELSLPKIRHVVGLPGALLLVALDEQDEVAGFAAAASEVAGTAHVHFVAVRPGAWGAGVGRELMRALPGRLAAAGFADAVLAVYTDNPRAVRLYTRLGWRPTGDPQGDRPQQRYRLDLRSAAGRSA